MNRANAVALLASRKPRGVGRSIHSMITSGPLYHTVGDREDAIRQLGIDFAQFENDLMVQLGWKNDAPAINESDSRVGWWRSNVVPVLDEWQKWQAKELGSYWERFTTNWESITKWRDRLVGLRDAASKAGFGLQSPEPNKLPTTIWQDAGSGMSNVLGGVWSFVKIVLIVGVVVGGIALIIAFARR